MITLKDSTKSITPVPTLSQFPIARMFGKISTVKIYWLEVSWAY